MAGARFGGVVSSAACQGAKAALSELNARVGPLAESYVAALEKIKIKEGIRLVMSISACGNKFFQVLARCLATVRQALNSAGLDAAFCSRAEAHAGRFVGVRHCLGCCWDGLLFKMMLLGLCRTMRCGCC